MTPHLIDGIEILLWPHSGGFGAFAAPWAFDLWSDREGLWWVDANRGPLNVRDYPASIDRYRALDGPAKARILKAVLAVRDDDRGAHLFEQYSVRSREEEIEKAVFLPIVADFFRAWRRRPV